MHGSHGDQERDLQERLLVLPLVGGLEGVELLDHPLQVVLLQLHVAMAIEVIDRVHHKMAAVLEHRVPARKVILRLIKQQS